jgi:hypothetical protein
MICPKQFVRTAYGDFIKPNKVRYHSLVHRDVIILDCDESYSDVFDQGERICFNLYYNPFERNFMALQLRKVARADIMEYWEYGCQREKPPAVLIRRTSKEDLVQWHDARDTLA